MLKQKEIQIPNFEDVTQVSLREVSETFSIYDHNIIEFYSTELLYLEQYVRDIFYYPNSMQNEVIEIGSIQIIKGSSFINVSEFLNDEKKPYGLLTEVHEASPQILLVQSEKLLENNNLEILSDIACSADKLRIILFLTVGEKAEILPYVNFSQVKSHTLSDVIHYRNFYEKEITFIEQFVRRFDYNFMI
ncbi:hypothetical protein ABE869_17520 [Enterococcus gilvus]|uniref:hypothetical protein n=1 Tax=Enterococcus gilvus TaxID=160453 RepID=UPI003D6A0EB5